KDFEAQLDLAKEFADLAPRDHNLDLQHEISVVVDAIADCRSRLATRTYSETERSTADRLLESQSIKLHPADDEKFCHNLLRALAESHRILLAMLQGRYDETAPRDPLFLRARLPQWPFMEGASSIQSIEAL